MNARHTIRLTGASARNAEVRLSRAVTLEFGAGEHIAIVGPNAAGKSLLADMLVGKTALQEGRIEYDFYPSRVREVYKNIRYIAFRDTYGSSDTNCYYQRRWNSTDHEEIPAVRELLGECQTSALQQRLFRLFQMEELLDKSVITLSSGEMRKFQLTKTLLTSPRVLIIDNPFIGLDAETRLQLTDLLTQLSGLGDLQLILVLSMLDDVPAFVTHVVPVAEMEVLPKTTREDYLRDFAEKDALTRAREEKEFEPWKRLIQTLPDKDRTAVDAMPADEIVRLNNVSIRYGERTILKALNWTVRRGEKWALSGANGSGKSTLLSLICADNPQSYACDITLFGKKRGTGESIWDIKRHIGYVSPEMHRAYLKNLPAVEIVASGLHDTVGLYVRPRQEQLAVCKWWMEAFGTAHLSERPFLRLSSGEQRLVLLARAFVKDPDLLILDEPLHGLDTYNRRKVKRIIEAFCRRKDKTLIMVTHYAEELPAVITHHLNLTKN